MVQYCALLLKHQHKSDTLCRYSLIKEFIKLACKAEATQFRPSRTQVECEKKRKKISE